MNVIDKHRYKCQKDNNPSFSSTLLDVIYRSIDERVDDEDSSMVCKKTMRKQHSFNNCTLQVEKQNMYHHHHNVGWKSGNIGSCLESTTETIYGFPTRPRPIRTSINIINTRSTTTTSGLGMYNSGRQQHYNLQRNNNNNAAAAANNNNNNNNNDNVEEVKNKSRAMKIYGYLKRGKQPISPGGGRLASFLVSLFTTKYVKKSNISSPCTGRHHRHDEVVVINHNATRINSKSSSSVSGSLTPRPAPARGKSSAVSFYPGNDSQPPRENRDRFDDDLSDRCMKERTQNLLKSYENNVFADSITNKEDEDGDDETGSYASSDLFELDHLSAIGIDDQCMRELPLYETTSVAANRAIANGFLV